MNKEQQDLAWQCLPKETRGHIRALCMKYDDTRHLYQTLKTEYLEEIFGRHNVFSDTESET